MKKLVLFCKKLDLIFLFIMGIFLLISENVKAQGTCTPGSFTTIGNATVLPSGELQLTPDLQYQKGGIWSDNQANLSQPFDYTAYVYLGDKNNTGADGLCFVLHNAPAGLATIGQDGRGIGACDGDDGSGGIKPSFTIEIDTWQNNNMGWTDPAEDHLAAHINGDGRHTSATNSIINPVTIDNIEDNAYHAFRVTWNPTTQLIEIYLDGTLKASTNYDLIGYFGGTSVYWGYTASTGDSKNRHAICPQGTLDAPIVANNDVYLNADGAAGGVLGNALTNDEVNLAPATTSNVTITVLEADPAGKVTLNTGTGAITLAAGTPDGVYTLKYQICETSNPSNCAYAYVKVDTRQYSQISITPEDEWAQQGVSYCWTATVLDNLNAPVAGVTVDFTVTGTNSSGFGGSAITDADGKVQYCYSGVYPHFPRYDNTITATINGTAISAATDVTWYIWTMGSVTLTPETGTSDINIENCWQAVVKDNGHSSGGTTIPPRPLPNQTVTFTVYATNSGVTGTSVTNSDGVAYFCYAGQNTGTSMMDAKSGSEGSNYVSFDWTAPVVKYPLSYDANGGTGNVPVDPNSPYATGTSVTVLGNIGSPALTRTGYVFNGWNTASNGSGTTYAAGNTFNMASAAVTLYAIWAPTYTLTYDANGGTGNEPVDANSPYEVGESVTVLGNVGIPTPLSKTDFTFGGWNTLANGTGTTYQAGGSFNMPNNNVVLYAIWNPNSNPVTYHANSGTGNVPVDAGSPYTPGANVTVLGNTGSPVLAKQYHTFGGWNTQANGGGTTYQADDSFTMPANAVTLYALWVPDTYTVTYDANGGTGNPPADGSSPYAVDASVTLLGNVGTPVMTKLYHTFGGWNTQADGNGTTYQAGGSFTMPASNVTLYAIWNADTYTVTYDANGATGNVPVDASSPYVVGATVNVLGNTGSPALTKQYHTFSGWNTEDDGLGTAYSASDNFNMPDNNVILYAIWTADTYTVTYDANGATGNAPVDLSSPYEVGGTVTVTGNIGTPALTKQYHTFGGWNTMANGGGTTYQSDNSFNMPDNNVTLYAMWTADTYTVTYDANGGTGNVPVDVNSPYEVGESVTVLGNVGTPNLLTKTDFTFGGWNTQANGGGTTYQADNNFSMPAVNVTLYAIWNCNNPTDGGQIAGNQTICYDNTQPDQDLTELSLPGGTLTGELEYKWQMNTVDPDVEANWSDFPGAVSNTLIANEIGSLTQSTWFRRLVQAVCLTQDDWQVSNVVKITVAPIGPAVRVNITASKAPNGQVLFKATPVNGGDKPYYKWYKSDGTSTTLLAEGENVDEVLSTCKSGDQHWVELTSSIPCTEPAVASNEMCTY